MQKYQVKSPGDALAYLTDCTLATVADMAMKKSRASNEFIRQKEIAQRAINWMDGIGVDYSTTRAWEVKNMGSVSAWADQYDVKRIKNGK